MSGRLEGKVAVVVGAGQTPGAPEVIGNGRATAMLFAREGARVVVVDVDEGSARETVRLIRDEEGWAEAVRADATSDRECRELIAGVVERLGRVDILHNNVGVTAGDSGPLHVDEASWDRLVGVNLKSVVFPCKHVLPVMRRQRSGAIVNVSSASAVVSEQSSVAYKTSKAGVNAYTQALAIANARFGVRANVVMPGMIDTPMARVGLARSRGADVGELVRRRNAMVPLRARQGTAWDVAHAALFLASDEARYITGVVLPVDGGISARVGVDPV